MLSFQTATKQTRYMTFFLKEDFLAKSTREFEPDAPNYTPRISVYNLRRKKHIVFDNLVLITLTYSKREFCV